MPKMIVHDGRVQLRNANGDAYSVPEAELQGAIESGEYRYETGDEFSQRQIARERGTLGQQAITAARNFADTATLGTSEAAAAAIGGEEYRQMAREQDATNPTTAMVAQIGGAVIPALLSGGESAIASAARLTPAGALARGSAALEGAVGRGLARAGIGGESAGILGNIANRGLSLGIAGAAEGGAYGVGQSLADSALDGTEWTAERALAGLEDGALYGLATGGALGAGGAALSGVGRKVIQKMLGEGTTLQTAVKDFANKRAIKQVVGEDVLAFRKITRNGDDMGRIDQLANKLRSRGILGDKAADVERALQREIDDADSIAGTIGRTLDERGVRPDASRLFGDVDEQVARLREAGTADHRLVARKVENQIEAFRRRSPSVRIAAPDGSVRRIQTNPTFTELRRFKTNLGKTVSWAKQTRNIATEEMEKLYGSVARNLDEAARAAGPDVETAWTAANRDMDDFITLRSGMKREAQRQAKASYFQQKDYLGGIGGALVGMAMGAGTPAALIAGVAGSFANKFIRERGAAALGKLADRVARSEFAMKDAANRLAGKPGRLAVRAAVATRSREQSREDYQKVRETMLAFQQHPQTVQARIEKAISPYIHEQPEVATAMARRVAGDYAWLQSKMPKPMTRADTSMTPTKEVERFAARDEIRIANYVEALHTPRSVFESIEGGHVNWDGIEALKERRPELWEAQRTYVIQALNEAEDPPGFRKRVLLGLAFDFPADWSMANVGSIQATFAGQGQAGGGKPAMAAVQTNPFEQPSEATL